MTMKKPDVSSLARIPQFLQIRMKKLNQLITSVFFQPKGQVFNVLLIQFLQKK